MAPCRVDIRGNLARTEKSPLAKTRTRSHPYLFRSKRSHRHFLTALRHHLPDNVLGILDFNSQGVPPGENGKNEKERKGKTIQDPSSELP
jgi:hypothetical protein